MPARFSWPIFTSISRTKGKRTPVLYNHPFLTNSRINLINSVTFFADHTQNTKTDRHNRIPTHFFDVSKICSRWRDQFPSISFWMLSTSVSTTRAIYRHARHVERCSALWKNLSIFAFQICGSVSRAARSWTFAPFLSLWQIKKYPSTTKADKIETSTLMSRPSFIW